MNIRKTKIEYIKFIAKNLRIEDQQEYYRVSGSRDFYDQILHGFECENSHTYTVVLGGYPTAIIGAIEKQDFQVAWACATDNVSNFKKSFVIALRYLTEKHTIHRKPFVNYVDAENKNAIKFLKASGFTILEKEPYGKLQEYFYPFYK